ncbi:hypothetical protein [Wolbachia endosymbiont of Dactylopius coccus]
MNIDDWAKRFVDDMERNLLEKKLLDKRFNAVEIVNTNDWEKIFDAIESDNSLSEHNVIDKIKEKLQDTSIVYKLWEMDNFNINYKFTMQHMYSSSKKSLLDMSAVHVYPKILRALLDKGANNENALDSYMGTTYINSDRPNTFYTPLSDSRKEVTELLITHEIKLKASEAKKPNFSTRDIFGDRINSDFEEEMSEYWDRCLDEVEKMKKEKIGNNVTFYDILTGKNDELASHVRKAKALEDDYKSKFPIYANDLERQFKIGNQRLDALKDTLVTEVTGNEGLQEAVVGNQDLRTAVTNTLKDDGNFQAAVKRDHDKEARKSLEIGIICGVIAALAVGVGCGVAGVQLSVLAIAGIAVAAALAVGIVAGGITYAVLKPSNKLDEPDSNKAASVAHTNSHCWSFK